MYNSNSFIKESIYQSQVHSIKKATNPPPIANKQTKRQTFVPNKPDEKMFLKYYEQNIELKNKQKQLLAQNRDLREKVNKNNQNTRLVLEQQLKNLALGKKSQWDTKQPLQKKVGSRGFSGNKGIKTNKVQHLLEIIDHYKVKFITAEQQITNLKRQKHLLEQDVKLKDKRYEALQEDKPQGQNHQDQINLGQKLMRNIRELELQKQRSKFLELGIKSLQAKLRTTQLKNQQIDELKSQNRSLQQKVIRMTNLPNFNNVTDRADEQRKAKQLENKLKLLNQKYNSLKDNHIKTEAELKLLQNKIIQSTSEIDYLQKQNQKLRQQSISNPLLLKLNNNPQLVQKIIIQIQNQKRSSASKEPQNSKFVIQRLMLQKQELAKQVLNYHSKIQTIQQNYKQRQRLSKLQKQQPIIAINQTKATSKQGIIYDGDVSVFSQQSTSIPPGTNYFDLFLGQVNLLETMIQSITGISNPSNPLILATIDFYNHNTQHSKLTQGCRCDLQSQFSFRVNQDDFFFKYLQKSSFQVDMWASEGSKNYHLGKATIDLKHLINRLRPRVSPVIQTSTPLFLNQKVLGSINLVMRMRLPIFDQLQKIKDINMTAAQNQEQPITRKLVIQIDQGRGFGEKSNSFVYYSFRLEDHYTKTSKGNCPSWKHMKMLEINYDTDFKNYLKKNQMQFIVFDDNVVVIDDKNSDVVGSAIISLIPLLQGKPIKERLQIRKGNQRKGTIDVKIFWYESQENNKNLVQIEEEKKLSPKGIHDEIKSFMKQHSVNAQKVFRLMDDNKTGLISYQQFQEWIFKISARRFTQQSINTYYKQFKQPLNIKNFVLKVNQQYQSPPLNQNQAIVAGIGMINQFLKTNSTHMKKTALDDFLVGKNIIQVMKQIPTDKAGYINKAKLQEYLDQHGLQAEIPGDRVRLMDFLKKHQKMNLTI